jgi:hypothetical protein
MNPVLWKRVLAPLAAFGVIILGGLLMFGGKASNDKPSLSAGEVAKADEQAPKTVDAPPPDPLPKPADAPVVTDTPKQAPASDKRDPAKAAAERRQLLETVGALTAAHCYQTYLNIGLIADGKAKGVYTDRDAYKVLDSVLSLDQALDRRLAAVDKLELDKEDRASLEQMLLVSSLLRKQAKELQIFWDTGRDEDAAQYESVRKDSWAALSKVMGIAR